MKKRKIAWILAMAMTATSIDSTALMAGATELATTEQEGLTQDTDQVFDVPDEDSHAAEQVTEADNADPDLSFYDVESDSTYVEDEGEQLFSSGESMTEPEEVFQDVYDADASNADSGSGTTITYPGFCTQINTSMDFTAEIKTEGEEAWFHFTPEEDGKYVFMTDENTVFARTHANLCEDVEEQEKPLLKEDEISGNWTHLSRITYDLVKGKQYLFRTWLDYGTGSYKVRVVKYSEDYDITSVTLNAENARKQYVQCSEYVYAAGAQLTFNYHNAPSQTVTVTARNAFPMDTYGHKAGYLYYNSAGEPSGSAGSAMMKAGTYKVRFEVEGYTPADPDSLSYEFTAGDPWTDIREGTTAVKRVHSQDDALWYKFVPTKSGTYAFDSPGGMQVGDKNANFANISPISEKWGEYSGVFQHRRQYILAQDQIYYVRFYYMDEDQGETADVTITRIPNIEKIQITSTLGEAIAGLKSYTEAKILVFFDNGPSKEGTLTFGSTVIRIDEMVFEPYLINDKDGTVHEVSDVLPAGDYQLIFRSGNVSSDPVPFAVKEITNSVLYKGAINCGREISVVSPYVRHAFYSFTAPETDRYSISDITSKYYDIYKKTGSGYQSVKYENIQALNAGDTILFKFYGGGDQDENASLSLLRRQDITAMSFPKKEYIQIEGMNPEIWIPGDLSIDYVDGSHAEIAVLFGKSSVEDNIGNTIAVEWLREDKNGNYIPWSAQEGSVAGEYKAIFTAGTVREEIRLSVLSVQKDAARLPQLKMGRQKLPLNEDGTNYYIFIPETDGHYSFNYSDRNVNASIGRWDEANNQLPYIGPLAVDRELTRGVKYFISFYTSQAQDFNLYIYKQPVAASVEILPGWENDNNVFIQNLETVYFDNLRAKVKMDDGTEEILSLGETDQYDKRLDGWLYLRKEDGTLENSPIPYDNRWSVSTGDYILKLGYGEKMSEQGIPVKILSLKDSGAPVLETDQVQTGSAASNRLLYQFTPGASGVYELEVNTDASLTVYDENGKYLINSNNEASDMAFNLEAGKTYFFSLYANNEYGPDVQLCIKKNELPVKLETTLLEDVTYIPGMDSYSDVRLQTVAIYEDGRREKVKAYDQIAGCNVYYSVLSESGKEMDFDETMKKGTYTITPVLTKDNQNLQIAAAGVQVKAEKPQVTETLILEQWTDVKETYRHLYRFTAAKDATYQIQTEEGADASFYREMSSRFKKKGQTYQMDEGESCIVAVSAYKDSRIRIVEKSGENPGQPGADGEITLTDGFSQEVTIKAGGEQIFVFTPTVSGDYRIKSEGGSDTKVVLYSDENQLGEDDDSGSESNFSLKASLEAGKTYRYIVDLYSKDESGTTTICFSFVQNKDIRKLELVLKEGFSDTNITLFSYPLRAYSLKVTYQDGSEKIIEDDYYPTLKDDYGNEIKVEASSEMDGDPETNEVFFVYDLMYKKEDGRTWKSSTNGKIPCGSISDIEALQIGTPKTASLKAGQECLYRFTVPEDGNYFIHFDSGNDELFLNTEFGSYYTYFQLGQWDVRLNPIRKDNSGLVPLKKGVSYLVYLGNHGEEPANAFSFYIAKADELTSVELKKAPDNPFVYPNADESISLDGMVITAHYADGSSKDILQGETDPAGRYVRVLYWKWIGNDTLRVFFAFGSCRSFVDLKAASTEQLPVLKTGETIQVPAAGNQLTAFRYTPEESGFYSFDMDQDDWIKVVEEETGKEVKEINGYYLEAGNSYQIYTRTRYGDDTITVLRGVCQWTEESEISATCTTDGSITYRCNVHNHTKTLLAQEAYGHTFGEWITVKEAGCETEGQQQRSCTRCHIVETRALPAKGQHSFGEWITVKEAGCETEGQQQRSCTRCHVVETRALPAKGQHSFGEWITTKDPTVLETGVKERICSQCGKKESASIEKLTGTISLSVKGTIPLKVKQSYKVKVTMGKGDKVVSWKSSNAKAVSVKNGVIKGRKAGKKATITVLLKSGKKASFKVKVQKTTVKTKKLTVTNTVTKKKVGKTVTLKKGKTLKLAAAAAPVTSQQKITYTSSDKKIASVTKKGQIKARKIGKATITVKSGAKTYRIKINVK